MRKRKELFRSLCLVLCLSLTMGVLAGCSWFSGNEQATPAPEGSQTPGEAEAADVKKPALPEKLTMKDGTPWVQVYVVADEKVEDMDIETYVQGVLAGEMRNDWPMEALKAQAILARTFVLKFIAEKNSRYDGADISTDITEAQAYDASSVNDRIKQAVEETRGQVLSYEGELPYAWFHAHAGGKTELSQAGLEFKGEEPGYTQIVESPDSDKAPTSVKNWTATFTKDKLVEAARQAGVSVKNADSVELGDRTESGRVIQIIIDGQPVSAPALRIQLDGKKLKSTMIEDVSISGDEVTFSGSGYGHGVGMAQWGAYAMAEEGKSADQIVQHYFKNVDIVSLWT